MRRLIDIFKRGDAVKLQRDGPKLDRQSAFVTAVGLDRDEFDAGHADNAFRDVEEDRPGLRRRSRYVEAVLELHASSYREIGAPAKLIAGLHKCRADSRRRFCEIIEPVKLQGQLSSKGNSD